MGGLCRILVYANFFISRITGIREELDSVSPDRDLSVELVPHFVILSVLSHFCPVEIENVLCYNRERKLIVH